MQAFQSAPWRNRNRLGGESRRGVAQPAGRGAAQPAVGHERGAAQSAWSKSCGAPPLVVPKSSRKRSFASQERETNCEKAGPEAASESDVEEIEEPHWAKEYDLAPFRFMSYNVGIDQGMLQDRPWSKHGTKLGRLLKHFVNVSKQEIVCLSELGGHRAGLNKTNKDLDSLLKQAVNRGECIVEGAFATCYNFRNTDALLIHEGVIESSVKKKSDMHWQAFLLNRRRGGAAQPALSGDGEVTIPLCVSWLAIAI